MHARGVAATKRTAKTAEPADHGRFGYARVSTRGQALEVQLAALAAVFEDDADPHALVAAPVDGVVSVSFMPDLLRCSHMDCNPSCNSDASLRVSAGRHQVQVVLPARLLEAALALTSISHGGDR
jgi:hypothetical protein